MKFAIQWPWETNGEDPAIYLDDVYRYARARLRSREDAEDVAIEARRKVAGRLRTAKEISGIFEDDLIGRFDHTSDDTVLVNSVLDLLTEDQRDALVLKYVVGMTSQEVGAALNKKPEAVDSLLQRGRAAFAREWNALSSEEVKK
jgi:DNA-directed RNA polymerase specialized sigma24 family protein